MRSMRRLAMAAMVVALGIGGAMAHGAHAGNALCPNTCLTGGLLGGGSSGSSVSTSNPLRAQMRAEGGMQTRNYGFEWTAIDASGTPGTQAIHIAIAVAGKDSGGTFTGHGTASLSKAGGNTVHVDVDLTDDGTRVSVMDDNANQTFVLQALKATGLGTAAYESSVDPSWDTPAGGDDCDGHDNNTGVGHYLGIGQGHDCD